MTQVVWKFVIEDPETPVEMPDGASILHLAEQSGQVCLWALVDSDAPRVLRRFEVYGTGHPLGEGPMGRFVGTVLLAHGALVLHVWEAA